MNRSNPYATPQADLATAEADGVDSSSPFSPRGRFARSTYIVYSFGTSMLVMLVVAVLAGTGAAFGKSGGGGVLAAVLTGVGYLAILVLGVVFCVRRLHDLNWSGWWSVVMFVPLVNVVLAIPMLFFRGTQGANKYGPPRPATRTQVVLAWLLFVVFVGGIVAAIAIPAYVDYSKRAGAQSLQSPTAGQGRFQ